MFFCLLGIGLVSAYSYVFPPKIWESWAIAPIYSDVESLNSTIMVYQSSTDIEGYELFSQSCDIDSRFLDARKGLYFFHLSFAQISQCEDTKIYLAYQWRVVEGSWKDISLSSIQEEIPIFLDYSSEDIQSFIQDIEKDIQRYSLYAKYQGKRVGQYYSYFQKQRKYFLAKEKKKLLENILEKREYLYSSPIEWKMIPERFTKMPNSGRPYREAYTDGIHHGWDIDTHLWDEAVALDDGYIIRVVDGFENEKDFERIKYGPYLTEQQEAENLDILRGNQVWLKTMKGEVVFYSHLGSVNPELQQGMFVQRWDFIGTVWITGVPWENYEDYHLHFAIMKNPYNKDTAGTYDFITYMLWDWLTKGMSYEETLRKQKEIFEPSTP